MRIVSLIVVFLSMACSGSLRVAHSKKDVADQIPVRRTSAFANYRVVQAWNAATNECKKTTSIEVVHLPVGEEYYVGFDGSDFAETKFAIELYESGAAKKVSLDSDPQADETISASATLVKELASAASTVASLGVGAKNVPQQALTQIAAADAACPAKTRSELAPLECLLSKTQDDRREELACPTWSEGVPDDADGGNGS